MKKKKTILKTFACILVLSLSLTVLQPLAVFAEQNINSAETTLEKWVPSEEDMRLPNTKGDLTLEQLETAKLLPEDTPEIVSSDAIEENGHVNRLWEQEQDLNTIIFQNKDGTKTAYHYSDPVKYADKNGKVKDKKNKLSETTTGEYTNAENDINAYFPKKIHKNKGVELKFGEYVFEMSPNINGSSGASRQTGHDKDSNPTEYVEYPEVFADDISLRYTPTFGGYKEDIILAKNTGINRFEFKLTTNGLSLVQASTGNYYLAEPLTGEYVTALGNVIVYDNTGVESEGYNHYYEVTTISQDEQYLITVIVDEHYLESKDTAYPVYVDPTLTVMPQGDVEDAALYSSNSETAYSGEIKIGYVSSYGTGRGLYNFPVFNFENDFIYMYGNQIVSAELNLYATIYGSNYASYNDAKTLSLHEFYSDWSPSTVKWSNTNPDNYNTLAISSKSVTTGWTAFNILPVIEQFKSDADYTMAFKGLLLKADSEVYTTWKKFVSSSGTMSRRPYITITYNDSPTACSQVVSGATYYLKNYNSEYLDVYDAGTTDNTRLLTYTFNGNANQQFKITNVSGGEYEIAPQHTTGKVLSVNSDGQVIIESDCNIDSQRWYIFYRNGNYHIVNKAYNSGVMAPTYSTDYVSINNEYDYCCWELEMTIQLISNAYATPHTHIITKQVGNEITVNLTAATELLGGYVQEYSSDILPEEDRGILSVFWPMGTSDGHHHRNVLFPLGTTEVNFNTLLIASGMDHGMSVGVDSQGYYTYYIDTTYYNQDTPKGMSQLASVLLSFVPILGETKDVQEGVTGVDILTGETLSSFDRVVSIVCVALPVISGSQTRIVKKGFTKLDNVDELFDASKGIVKTLNYVASSGVELASKANKTTTILGSYDRDIRHIISELEYPKTFDFGAKPGGFNILNIPNGFYKNGTQFWNDFNKEFIDKAVERGDNIILATPATNNFLYNENGITGFGREIEYLTTQKGYSLSADKTRLIKN